MPGSYPVLSSNESYCYPVRKKLIQRAGVHTFANLSQIRYKKGVPLIEFEFHYSRISTADKDALKSFYDSQKGEYSHDWTLDFDGTTYTNCQFVGGFQAQEVGPKIWSVTLRVRTTPAPSVLQNITAASLSITAAFIAGGGSAIGAPSIDGVFGTANITQVDQSASHFGIPGAGALTATPTTLSYTFLSAQLPSLPLFSLVGFIGGTLNGTDTPPAELRIYEVSMAVTYQDGSTATLLPAGINAVTGNSGGIFGAGVSGQVANAGAALDGDSATYASITRTNFNGLSSAGYLQLQGFK